MRLNDLDSLCICHYATILIIFKVFNEVSQLSQDLKIIVFSDLCMQSFKTCTKDLSSDFVIYCKKNLELVNDVL
jgi:hypothetical protein